MITPIEFCEKFNPCPEGLVFVQNRKTLAEAWEQCHRPDWMLWSLECIAHPQDHKNLRLFAIWCAKNTPTADGGTTGELLTDPRSIAALDVAERFANGLATEVELDAARAAAWAAAEATAGDAAWATAWATADATAWATADATARAAARAAAWAAAEATAGDAAWAAQANQLRTMVSNPFKEGAK